MVAVRIARYDELTDASIIELIKGSIDVEVRLDELKSESLGRIFEKELGAEALDEAFMKILESLRPFQIEAYATYVDKRELKPIIENAPEVFELRDKLASLIESMIQKESFERLLEMMGTEYKVLIVDDNFFKTRKPPKRLERGEWARADSSGSPGLQVADLVAGCVKRALLHGGGLKNVVNDLILVKKVAATRALVFPQVLRFCTIK